MFVQLENLKKSFRDPVRRGVVRAVDGVSLQVREGEHLALVGESGSGKTTLGRLILKLYPADSGNIYFDGQDITGFSARQMRPLRRGMQMVFQDPVSSLDPRYSVERILGEAVDLIPGLTPADKQRRIAETLAAVQLPEDSRARFPHEFSGGERQRIAIARALVMQPRLLILDEAVSALDVLVQEQILDLLQTIPKRYAVTFLFISHNLRVVRRLCQRVAVMWQGRLVEIAPTETLFQDPRHPYTRQLLAAALTYKSHGGFAPRGELANSQLSDQGNGHFVLI